MGNKTSIIFKIPKEELIDLINNSDSISEVLNRLGYTNSANNYRTFHLRIKQDNISLESLYIRLVCPNCHSQTDTYSGRNIHK